MLYVHMNVYDRDHLPVEPAFNLQRRSGGDGGCCNRPNAKDGRTRTTINISIVEQNRPDIGEESIHGATEQIFLIDWFGSLGMSTRVPACLGFNVPS